MAIKKQINKFFNKELRTLIFFITTKCNCHCKHCFYSTNRNVNELTLNEIEKIIKNLPYLETVQFSGGEPFIREDLYDIIKLFVNKGVKKIGIPTNGFFTEKIISQAKKIKELNVDISINVSIDGFKDLHNKIRGIDCWDNAIDTFKQLRKNGIKSGFLIAVSKINYPCVIKLMEYLSKLNPSFINPIIVRAKPEIMLSPEQFKEIRPTLEKFICKYENKFYIARQKLLYNIYYDILSGKELPYKCQAGKIIAVLEPDGGVRSCELRRVLGNVRDNNYNINKILKLDKIPNRCKDCIHPCFIGPSMSYSIKWMLKNILYQYAL